MDFQHLQGDCIVQGLGRLKPEYIAAYEPLVWELVERALKFTTDYRADYSKSPKQIPLVRRARHLVLSLFSRLRFIDTTFDKTQGLDAGFQRAFLELTALLNYFEIFRPRMDGEVEMAPGAIAADPEIMGTFVWEPADAELLYRGRIPYWVVHPVETLGRIRVDKVAPVHAYPSNIDPPLCNPGTRPIFHGKVDTGKLYPCIAEDVFRSFKTEVINPFSDTNKGPSDLQGQDSQSRRSGARTLSKQAAKHGS